MSQDYHNLRVTAFNRNVEELGKQTGQLLSFQDIDPQRFPVCPECKKIYESMPPGGDS